MLKSKLQRVGSNVAWLVANRVITKGASLLVIGFAARVLGRVGPRPEAHREAEKNHAERAINPMPAPQKRRPRVRAREQHRDERERGRDDREADLVGGLTRLLGNSKKIAMQYSPNCAVPYVAMVDAGTVELVRSLGVEVATSANLPSSFQGIARRMATKATSR